jgi:predicted enzyme related to lactoylglutathione lyase
MPRVVHFEISGDDPAELAEFYQKAFDWSIQKWEGPEDYWLASTGEEDQPGINGAIMHRTAPSESTVNTIDVPSLDEFIERVTGNGGTVVMGKTAVPGIGYMAYCKDPQGNTFGMMEEDPTAR